MTVDESTYDGGTNGDYHPFAWYHEFDGGRAFYTGAGHTDESYSEDLFLKHILGGIQYAIGDNLNLDYSKATTQIPPDANRFSKIPLVGGEFFEPTEMAVLPNNDVLISQRRGEIMLYDDETKELKQVALLDVYHKTLETPGVNAEEGVMGLQKDPNYETNNWIYVYYAPTGDQSVNRLSRFKYADGNFDMASEQVILDVDSDREICCHTGGSIAFGPDNLLYLSTGDNSTPFNEKGVKYVNNGFAPLNDIPGHEQYDARRSSGNTNDLRGKILRIKVNDDGSYDIPEGNLFPVGTDKTRPEIYTMGHRNPYRISVDPKNGNLFWGEVGPDARADSMETRGPRGYDEMNLALEAGNFGWPLFIGDNQPYHEYDYETGESGAAFDPENPINDSKNNTGLRELPPVVPAYIYYPYDETQLFPQVGTGGRNAMAGPTYYSNMYPEGGGLPDYYDGKTIIYEWMRGWMMAVSLFEDGSFNKME
ncbi:MAG: ThuA domain-containing protein, partial [Pricia sp.]|nr:ThuA domain-containing protein [Pricia sp.]